MAKCRRKFGDKSQWNANKWSFLANLMNCYNDSLPLLSRWWHEPWIISNNLINAFITGQQTKCQNSMSQTYTLNIRLIVNCETGYQAGRCSAGQVTNKENLILGHTKILFGAGDSHFKHFTLKTHTLRWSYGKGGHHQTRKAFLSIRIFLY